MAEILAAVVRLEAGEAMLTQLKTMLRHAWLEVSDAERAIPPDMLARLTQRVTASEARHSGEIRIYVEAALPISYLWRLGPSTSMAQVIRQRATMIFSKLGVWDTEHNNGVLIYLQLAERAIEIVADRGLHLHVAGAHWQAVVTQMSAQFKQGKFEDGLTDALAEVSALLQAHFPQELGHSQLGHSKLAHSKLADNGSTGNQQPDEPVLT